MKKALVINQELRDLLPPLSPKQFAKLESEILKDGCTAPLVVWGDVIVDGHHRYTICTKHDIEFQTTSKTFESMDDAKLWMWQNQNSRRNLSRFQRAEIALKMKPIVASQSRNRQVRKSRNFVQQNSAEQKETRQILAEFADVSHDTLDRVEFLLKHADVETLNTLRWDKKGTSINREYTSLKAKIDAKQPAKAKKTKASTATSKSASKKATAKEPAKDSVQSTLLEPDAAETEQTAKRPTEIAPRWKGVKEQQTYSCGVRFEPDPDDDFFDWITREEREALREDQKASPALRLVPLIRNYTIQSIPEHDPQYLVSCLFSLFQPLYREKLLYALTRKMFAQGESDTVRKFLATLTDECQS